ncbi:MAG: hypothetical protein ACJ8ER_14735 [Allosphingosinicella sp.]
MTQSIRPEPDPIPVVCDLCRAEGQAGEDPFAAFGALLDFEPVPRKKNRVDGWDPETQRAFIAALSLTGSIRQAARAVGKAQFGAEQLFRAEGNESFLATAKQALAMAADDRGRRLAEGVRAVAAERTGRRIAPPPWSRAASRRLPAPEPQAAEDGPAPDEDDLTKHLSTEQLQVIVSIVNKYYMKLEAERSCRLEGRIAEADFYLRQITMLEVAADVVSGDGMAVLKRARLGDHDLLHIAETDMSVFLDGARRKFWDEAGDPPRPEYPPRHLLEQHDGHATEPLTTSQFFHGGGASGKRAEIEAQCARDARAQVEWEAEARRDYERRRDSDAANDQEPGSAGGPAPEGRQD